MIVRIFWGRLVPGAWPSVEQVYRQFDAAHTAGLRARLVAQDLNDSESMYTIAFWDDMASLQRWLDSDAYRQTFLPALRPFLTGSQSVSVCSARMEDMAGLMAQAGAGSERVRGAKIFGSGDAPG